MSSFSIPLIDWQVLSFSGIKVQPFLQGQFTIDLHSLESGQVKLAAYCNPQGRVLALFYLCRQDSNYFAILPKSSAIDMQTRLKPYAALSKIQIQAREDLSIWGFDLNHFQDHFDLPKNCFDSKPLIVLEKNELAVLLPQNPNAEPRLFLLASKESYFPIKNQHFQWHLLDLNQGIPWITPSNSGIFLPQELQLLEKDCVSLKKGCYVGQEVIARLHYRSQFKRQLYKIQTTQPVAIGSDIFLNTQAIGKIVDLITLDENIHIGLATLPLQNFTLETTIFSDVNDNPIRLVSPI